MLLITLISREKTQQLVDCKASLLQTNELLESKTNMLEELTAQRHKRLKEKRLLLTMIQEVQRDIESITELEDSLGRECADLQKNAQRLRDEEYEPLHEKVNKMRQDKGLNRIPHMQQDIEAQMARKLKERRENWQQGTPSSSRSPDGLDDLSHRSSHSTDALDRSRNISRGRGRPKRSR
ncbi:uncharacterized protein BX664DRAFT_146972 [Halteromyces radiatus]|uniref:uncharacterized protein n=1 Tax=Halteromyces radiatus TaxID=101107 RepID=UPI0022207063|nr:uncharacterized protein BX664DRAFT_146972 [Halteromyces radiatus]KAI8090012.1 hypothetical protein BX664DRAFT_146972 [Halteromyces radiatus]